MAAVLKVAASKSIGAKVAASKASSFTSSAASKTHAGIVSHSHNLSVSAKATSCPFATFHPPGAPPGVCIVGGLNPPTVWW